MNTTTLKSGRELGLGIAPFSSGMKLFKTVCRELQGVEVKIDGKDLDLRKLAGQDINTIKDAILKVLGSDGIEQCFFECAARCTLGGVKIGRDTFEPEDMRGDFLPCAWEVIKYNLAPFFSNLDFVSSTPAAVSSSDPASG